MTTETSPCNWLMELHSKLWDRQDLRPSLFREVEITVELYHTLLERLTEIHPDRDTPNYDARASKVLSAKLQCLQPFTSPSLGEQPPRSDNELVETKGDKDSGESDVVDAELNSFLPTTIRFLDLSSLELKYPPPRLPLPLFLRRDYDVVSRMIEEGPKTSTGSVVVSGQPGTGEA